MNRLKFQSIFILALCLMSATLAGCGGAAKSEISEEAQTMPSDLAEEYTESVQALDGLEYGYQQYLIKKSPERLTQLLEAAAALEFNFESEGLTKEDLATCRRLSLKIDSTKMSIMATLAEDARTMRKMLVEVEDQLVAEKMESPMYLAKDSKLYVDLSCSSLVTAKLINMDSRSVLKTYTGKKHISDSITVPNSAIYLFEVTVKGNQYIDMKLSQGHLSIEQLAEQKTIESETVEATASDFRVTKVNGIQMQPVFEEPKKITLRSQGKAFFSGSSRSVVTISVPKGAVDLLYSLRISTNEGDRSSDGQFCKDMSESYKKVKFLGLPIYESQGNKSSLIRELLNDNVPPREEEAYCNIYVFTSQDQAKKFQDGVPASELKYNVDLSAFGTQSCNGRIPVKGRSVIYLGFENERFRYSNYLWLEVISSVPHTEYYQTKYKVTSNN